MRGDVGTSVGPQAHAYFTGPSGPHAHLSVEILSQSLLFVAHSYHDQRVVGGNRTEARSEICDRGEYERAAAQIRQPPNILLVRTIHFLQRSIFRLDVSNPEMPSACVDVNQRVWM